MSLKLILIKTRRYIGLNVYIIHYDFVDKIKMRPF